MNTLIKENTPLEKYNYLEVIHHVWVKLALVIIFSCLMANSANAQLVHPGGWHTQEDLTLIRTKVAAKEEPWITGWNAARNQGPDARTTTNPSVLITRNGAMHGAGFDAWVLTMKWVASGDSSYSDAAINIIDTWVDTVRDFDVYGPTLTLSSGAGAMAQAAEILEHGFNGEAGWPQWRADAAKDWFKSVVYDPWTNTGTHRSSNWGTSALGGNMSMAVFMDDFSEYSYQREAYQFGYPDTHDGCASLTDYVTHATGQAFETGRDQPHVQGGIAHLTEAALVMWNQGDELVYLENNRLLAGVEYHARYNIGFNDLPFDSNIPNRCNIRNNGQDRGISDSERGLLSPVYYMSAKLFSQAGLPHPNTKAVLSHPGYSPEINNFAHPGLGMFTFVSTSSNSDSSISGGNPNDGGSTVVQITKRNASGFAIDANNGAINGQNLFLWSENSNNANQRWIEIDRGNNYYSYQKQGTNHCIDGGNGGASRQNVYLWDCNANNQNQHWLKASTDSGFFKLIKRNSPGFAINGGSRGANGQNVNLYSSSHSSHNLQWSIDKL